MRTGTKLVFDIYQRALPIGKYPSIFQAEIYAIYEIKSKVVMNCVTSLNALGIPNKVT